MCLRTSERLLLCQRKCVREEDELLSDNISRNFAKMILCFRNIVLKVLSENILSLFLLSEMLCWTKKWYF